MKHEINESTRKAVRGIITTIRIRQNCSKAEAEELFRRSLCEVDVEEAVLNAVEEDIEHQKFMSP